MSECDIDVAPESLIELPARSRCVSDVFLIDFVKMHRSPEIYMTKLCVSWNWNELTWIDFNKVETFNNWNKVIPPEMGSSIHNTIVYNALVVGQLPISIPTSNSNYCRNGLWLLIFGIFSILPISLKQPGHALNSQDPSEYSSNYGWITGFYKAKWVNLILMLLHCHVLNCAKD